MDKREAKRAALCSVARLMDDFCSADGRSDDQYEGSDLERYREACEQLRQEFWRRAGYKV